MNQKSNATKTGLTKVNSNQDVNRGKTFGFRNGPKPDRLQENTTYTGEIKSYTDRENDKGLFMFSLEIELDNNAGVYAPTVTYEYSPPFKRFIEDVDKNLGRDAVVEDLVGMRIEFSIRHRGKFNNFETLCQIDDFNEELTI